MHTACIVCCIPCASNLVIDAFRAHRVSFAHKAPTRCGKDVYMKNRRNRLTPEQIKERRRREAEMRRIYDEEGFTEEEIKFMSKPAQRAFMEKYGMR